MPTRLITTLVVSLLALLGTCTPSAMAAFPGSNGRIVFSSNRTGDAEIYSMNPDGSDVQNLTNSPGGDASPRVSADGGHIVFSSTRDDASGEIYVMDADGDHQTRLTNAAGADTLPAWSPDGTKIVWTSDRAVDNEIWVMNANGSSPTRLTTHVGEDSAPAFSPDGTKIAYNSERGGQSQWDIAVMNANGTNDVDLTNSPADTDTQPAWSPDGTKITFAGTHDHAPADGGGIYEVYSMNANGTSVTRLTHSTSVDSQPAWSPDGTEILWSSDRALPNHFDVWAMDPSGDAHAVNLTQTGNSFAADWAPCDTSLPGGCVSQTSSASLTDSQYSANESAGHVDVTVRRSGGLNGAASVAYSTSNGSATAGSDYTATSGTVSFALGENEKTFSVPVTNDSANEGNENFHVTLSNPGAGAQLTSPTTATVTIIDDDSGSAPASPETSITSGPTDATWVDQPQFRFSSTTPGASFRCRTDGQVFAPCSSLYTSARLPAGDHTFSVYAIAPNGVADPTPATRSFHVNSAQTTREECEVSPFSAVDTGHGTGDQRTTCEIYFGERPSCQAYKVCEFRPVECPFGAICTLGTTASWTQVERSYFAVTYANSRLEQTSPPLTASGRFSKSCITVKNCSATDTQQAMGRAPMVSTCSALVTVPTGPGYVNPPHYFIGAAGGSMKLGCRATLKISPAPAYKLYGSAGKLATFLPSAGRVTVTALGGVTGAAVQKKHHPAPIFKPIARTASGAGAMVFAPKLSAAAKRSLNRKHRLGVRVRVAFTPRTGGKKVTKTQKVTLRPQAKRPRTCVRKKRRAKRPKTCVPARLR
jgi:Tol biopolymer transport system component